MEEHHSTEAIFTKRKADTRKRLLIGVLIALLVGFIIGILIGRFGTCPDNKPIKRTGAYLKGVDQAIIQDGDPEIANILIKNVKSENIKEYLR